MLKWSGEPLSLMPGSCTMWSAQWGRLWPTGWPPFPQPCPHTAGVSTVSLGSYSAQNPGRTSGTWWNKCTQRSTLGVSSARGNRGDNQLTYFTEEETKSQEDQVLPQRLGKWSMSHSFGEREGWIGISWDSLRDLESDQEVHRAAFCWGRRGLQGEIIRGNDPEEEGSLVVTLTSATAACIQSYGLKYYWLIYKWSLCTKIIVFLMLV